MVSVLLLRPRRDGLVYTLHTHHTPYPPTCHIWRTVVSALSLSTLSMAATAASHLLSRLSRPQFLARLAVIAVTVVFVLVHVVPQLNVITTTTTASKLGRQNTTVNALYSSENPYYVHWEGWFTMQQVIQHFWHDNLFCETIDVVRREQDDADLPILINMTFGCLETFQQADAGTGNYLSLFYAIRLAAQVYSNVGFIFACPDAPETKRDLILPWITGSFPPRAPSTTSEYNASLAHVCGNYDVVPVAYMHKEIQRDLRKMAMALVGVPSSQHASADFLKEYQEQQSFATHKPPQPMHQVEEINELPLYGADEFVLDDALIHFRCGDLMDTNHASFGFMTFNGYVRHVSPEARSIGVLTQPFEDSEHSRLEDNGNTTRNRCRVTVMSLVEFINIRYPNATVRIHNDPSETIALTYARMIMANQTIVGISSFGVFPAIATFGTGYVRRPDYPSAPNKWLMDPPIDQIVDNLVLFDEPKRIMTAEIGQLWQTEGERGVLKWFWDEDWIPGAEDEVILDANSTHNSEFSGTRDDGSNTSSIVQDSDIFEDANGLSSAVD
jgi:hypothetical protein